MGFTKKTLHCLGCKAKIAPGLVACAQDCKPKEGEVCPAPRPLPAHRSTSGPLMDAWTQ